MKLLTLSILMIVLTPKSFATDLNEEICSVFATKYSGVQAEEEYEYETVYAYCLDRIQPELVTDELGSYYEFQIFICGNTYQTAVMGYDPATRILEDLAGSGSSRECPYSSYDK